MKPSFWRAAKIAWSVGALASNGCSPTDTGAADVRDSGAEPYDSLNEHASFTEVRPGTQDFLPIDDMDRLSTEYPMTPPSSFFWSSPSSPGLGNWFVTSATGSIEDGATRRHRSSPREQRQGDTHERNRP